MGSKNSSRSESILLNEKLNNEITDKLGIKKDPESVKKFKEFLKKKFKESQLINAQLANSNSLYDKHNTLLGSVNSLLSLIYSINLDHVTTSFYDTTFLYDVVQPCSNAELFYSRKIDSFGVLINGKREIERKKTVSIGSKISIRERKYIDDTNANMNVMTSNVPIATVQEEVTFPVGSEATDEKLQTMREKETLSKKEEFTQKAQVLLSSMISPKDTILPHKTRSVSRTRKKNPTKLPLVNIRINLKDLIKQDVYENSILEPKDRFKTSSTNKHGYCSISDANELAHISKLNYTQTNVNDGSFIEIVDLLVTSENERAGSKSPRIPNYHTARTHSNDKLDQRKFKLTQDQFRGVASQFPMEEYRNKITCKGKTTEKSIV